MYLKKSNLHVEITPTLNNQLQLLLNLKFVKVIQGSTLFYCNIDNYIQSFS